MGGKVRVVLASLWFAFAAPGTVQTALPAWEHVFHDLPSHAQFAGLHQPGPAPALLSPPATLPPPDADGGSG